MINTAADIVPKKRGGTWPRKSVVAKRNTGSAVKLSGAGRSRIKKSGRIVGRTGRRVARK